MLIVAFALASLIDTGGHHEVARIQAHLDGALQMVDHADTSGLTEAQLARRHEHIARLRAYRDAGVFPANDDHPGQEVPALPDSSRSCDSSAGHRAR